MQNRLRNLPSVHELLDHSSIQPLIEDHGHAVVTEWIRSELSEFRSRMGNAESPLADLENRGELADCVAAQVVEAADKNLLVRLGRVINATGVILHTGLGRATLSEAATAVLSEVSGAANVEFDLQTGERRQRGYQLRDAWKLLTDADDAAIVNNNAAATLLTLQALCHGREVIISRGQLIEIGGSFRLPEIFAASGAIMREVGTTNHTRVSDYEQAITSETAAIMRVHPSNYRVVGFAKTPEIAELSALAHKHQLISIDDIGSGALVDTGQFGLPGEPTFQSSIEGGADVVLGSGDKLLGGPQCGIILGTRPLLRKISSHPLARTYRIGKLTLGALAATLESYLRDCQLEEIPTLAMLAATEEELLNRAQALCDSLEMDQISGLEIGVERESAPVGGGSLPGAELPTAVLVLTHAEMSSEEMSRRLRTGSCRLVTRNQQNTVRIDLRSVAPADDAQVAHAVRLLVGHPSAEDSVE